MIQNSRTKQAQDTMLSGLIPYIESLPNVTQVNLTRKAPCPQSNISIWERIHNNILPTDYKSFLLQSDGMHLLWTSSFENEDIIVGKINISGTFIILYKELNY